MAVSPSNFSIASISPIPSARDGYGEQFAALDDNNVATFSISLDPPGVAIGAGSVHTFGDVVTPVSVVHCDETLKEAPPALVNLTWHRTASVLLRELIVPVPCHDPASVAGAARTGVSAAPSAMRANIRLSRMRGSPSSKTGMRIEYAGEHSASPKLSSRARLSLRPARPN